jgi:hypothetical protein
VISGNIRRAPGRKSFCQEYSSGTIPQTVWGFARD